MPKYSMVLTWSEEDQAYIVSVPELPGCMADGKTPELAVKEAETVIQMWIECAIADGDPIPEPRLFKAEATV
ncbi:MAG: type II toxin-antitoxin system HicB family antitoxin [Lachnospiraceae bacterium]|nr:type II toxin-antitoxin system HicB family antitoxin [Lachnospiraceae bacterium]